VAVIGTDGAVMMTGIRLYNEIGRGLSEATTVGGLPLTFK